MPLGERYDIGTPLPSVGRNWEARTDRHTGKNLVFPSSNLPCVADTATEGPGDEVTSPEGCQGTTLGPVLDSKKRIEDDISRTQPSRELGTDVNGLEDVEAGTGVVEACIYTKDGVCHLHGQAELWWRPKKTWVKGKNGLYRWKYGRVEYFKCIGQTDR